MCLFSRIFNPKQTGGAHVHRTDYLASPNSVFIMKRTLLSLLALSATAVIFGQCDGNRFRNFVFPGYNVTSNLQYGQNVNYAGQNINLLVDVYEPQGDTEVSRPLVIMIHGGSFVGGSKTGQDVVPLAQDLCRMGYVVASISYRLGLQGTPLFPNQLTATEGVIRGYHDFKAAVRWFRKGVAENGNPFKINPEEIYACGVSAGGFVALHAAYLDEEDEMPVYDPTHLGLEGGLDGMSGNPGYSSEIKAVVNIAGAFADTSWIHPGDEPVLLFHGTNDGTVPFDFELLYFLGTIPIVEVAGSNAIAIRAEEVGLTYCFEIHEGYGHVPHTGYPAIYDTTRSMISSFLSHFVCPSIALDCGYREVENLVSVEELTTTDQLLVFPNPTRDRITLQNLSLENPATLRIYDAAGRLVMQERIAANAGQREISVGTLAAGIHRLVLTDDNGSRLGATFVIER